MRRLLSILITCHLSLITALAQTAVSSYMPGVTSEGAVYCLPKTGVRITIHVEKTTYTPGDFCKYAERYLRLMNVSEQPSVSYRIVGIQQEPFAVADTSKMYAIKFDARTAASNIRLSDDGILLAINAPSSLPKGEESPANGGARRPSSPSGRPGGVPPRQYLSEEILSAGSTAKMAELTAQDIYEIRESRNLLTRGQADYMPKDGEQLRLMLSQLEQQDRALTSLFAGITVSDTTEFSFTVIPDKVIKRDILFRFSQKLGLVDSDDLAGVPYYITIENLSTVPQPETIDPKKKGKQQPGVYVNVPGRMRSTIADATKTLVSNEYPAGQFGNVELLSGALFNKRYTTHLLLHPISGAVDRLDAEQPK